MESPEHNHYLKYLQTLADESNIEFVVNASFNILQKLYSQSKIFWHAAGFDEDENIHPEHTEHFGITTVEAMASGLVPVVVAKGGLTEIVSDGVDGFLWSTIPELIDKTNALINSSELTTQLSLKAIEKSQLFTKEKFAAHFLELINQ
jgi:glycosyltransferase involved in cell wall biosynthesis